jgi:Fe-S-cluster containining protein
VNSEDFDCQMCGNCCRVPGYVHLTDQDIDHCADYLGLSVDEFVASYTRLTKYRTGLSLTECSDGACIFLSDENRCMIEEAKPEQCRQFPFKWRYQASDGICPALENMD